MSNSNNANGKPFVFNDWDMSEISQRFARYHISKGVKPQDVEDVCNDGLCNFLKKAHKDSQASKETPSYSWAYIYLYQDWARFRDFRDKKTYRKHLSVLTQNAHHRHGVSDAPEPVDLVMAQEHEADGHRWRNRLASDLKDALSMLPPLHRKIVRLYHIEDYSLEELAKRFGLTVGHISTIVCRSCKNLRVELEGYRNVTFGRRRRRKSNRKLNSAPKPQATATLHKVLERDHDLQARALASQRES